MFSNESSRQADACRFCWMCRHICPVAACTGNEGWTPRARGLMVSMIERGTEYITDIAEAMYHCSLCDACANDCATGFKPSLYIREARTLAVVNDIAPTGITRQIDNIYSSGNIFNETVDSRLIERIRKLPETADNLLYIGQSGRVKSSDTVFAIMDLLDKSGTEYTAMVSELPSGAFLSDLMGYTGDVQALAKRNSEGILKTGSKKIIVCSPYDAVMFREKYSEWNCFNDIEIITVTSFISKLISEKKINLGKMTLTASLQEPVKLTRGLDEIEPLNSIVKHAGIENVRMFLNGKMSRCIGSPVLEQYAPEVVQKMVASRFLDADRLGCRCILAASTDDSYILRKYVPEGFKAEDLYILLNANS